MLDGRGPMITAILTDGPMPGTSVDVPAVEGRPPKTIDVEGPGDGRSRYCLSDWEQSGSSALYSFLYEVGRQASGQDDDSERAASEHDRGAEMHERNAERLERHGASREASRERDDAQLRREAAAEERSTHPDS